MPKFQTLNILLPTFWTIFKQVLSFLLILKHFEYIYAYLK